MSRPDALASAPRTLRCVTIAGRSWQVTAAATSPFWYETLLPAFLVLFPFSRVPFEHCKGLFCLLPCFFLLVLLLVPAARLAAATRDERRVTGSAVHFDLDEAHVKLFFTQLPSTLTQHVQQEPHVRQGGSRAPMRVASAPGSHHVEAAAAAVAAAANNTSRVDDAESLSLQVRSRAASINGPEAGMSLSDNEKGVQWPFFWTSSLGDALVAALRSAVGRHLALC